jgi:hypothetical protein
VEKLGDDQLVVFDREYVDSGRWWPIQRCIDRDYPDGQFTFLDVGGGNGLFADRILKSYPNSRGVVLDNSDLLLSKNKSNTRKRTILGSANDLGRASDEKFDLVFVNWLLHHLVDSSSYRQSRENINHVLRTAMTVLTERGRVSVYENMYNGLILDGAPGWIVYQLTAAKKIAKLVRKAGANTAGVGVCFLSRKQWCRTVEHNGFRILDYTDGYIWPMPWIWHLFLHIRHIRSGHFWLGCAPILA